MRKDTPKLGNIIEIDESKIRDHLGELVRGSVEETLNAGKREAHHPPILERVRDNRDMPQPDQDDLVACMRDSMHLAPSPKLRLHV